MAKVLNLCSPGGGVGFSLNGTTYRNNSLVTLEYIGEGGDALLCMTEYSTCCKQPDRGNWFFPNGTRVPTSNNQWDFHRTRDQMVVLLQRRRGGEDGVYRCEILDELNVTQTIYIGVYTASTGEWDINNYTTVLMLQKSGDRNSGVCIMVHSSLVCAQR